MSTTFAKEARTNLAGSMEALMSVIVEIRAAEGGDDAKRIMLLQLAIYQRRALRRGL